MKTLITYASKYGSTKKCAQMVAAGLISEADLVDLKESIIVDLDKYDTVVIGGSVMMGVIQREVREFLNKYETRLLDKKLGLFICNMRTDEDAQAEIEVAYPKILRDKATAVEYFGGELNMEKLSRFDKFIIKSVTKERENLSALLEPNIDRFIDKMNQT